MDRRYRSVVLLFAAALLAVASPSRAQGWTHDASLGIRLTSSPTSECVFGAVSDLKGGAMFLWADPCSLYLALPTVFPHLTFHAAHLLKRGDLDPTFPAVLPLDPHTPFTPAIMPDSLGGLYFVALDERNVATSGRDLYAYHVRANGTADPAWPATGRGLCTAPGSQLSAFMVSDGHRGMIAAWADRRDSAANLSDIYATHLRSDGTLDPAWPANGLAVYVGPANQSSPTPVADGAGGALIVWVDRRTPANSSDIYIAHVLANGTLDPAWPAGGLAVAATTSLEQAPRAVSDGAGGAFVGWARTVSSLPFCRTMHVKANGTLDSAWPAGGLDLDPSAYFIGNLSYLEDGLGGLFIAYDKSDFSGTSTLLARHVLANGSYDPQWPAQPVKVCDSNSNTQLPFIGPPFNALVPSGTGGFVVMFYDDQDGLGNFSVLSLQRVNSDGSFESGWSPHGRVISRAPSTPAGFVRVADGLGNEIDFFTDGRDANATVAHVYAQRVTRSGFLGTLEPSIAAVRDVPNDQGGRSTVLWYSSAVDTLDADPVSEYDVWRRLDVAPATLARLVSRDIMATHAWSPGEMRAQNDGTASVFWEFMGSAPARGIIPYALTVSTRGDSTAAGLARETFEVDAHLTISNITVTSDPDSGYSVDNIAPVKPSPFTGTYVNGISTLHWQGNVEPDLAGYHLYRGNAGFVPSPANLLKTLSAPDYTDFAGHVFQYKLSALDVHGNESGFNVLTPGGVLDVGPGLPAELALSLAGASPARERTALALALPSATRVRLTLHDVAGRRVRTLVDGPHAAGEFNLPWDLRDDAGRAVPAGLYIAVLDGAGRRIERRIMVVR